MSYKYWWALLKIKESEYQDILPYYLEFQAEANDWRNRSIICSWENAESDMLKSNMLGPKDKGTHWINDFLSAFRIAPYERLWNIMMEYAKPTQDNVIQFMINNYDSPVAILSLGIGQDNLRLLPGVFCNFLLNAREVQMYYPTVKHIFSIDNRRLFSRTIKKIENEYKLSCDGLVEGEDALSEIISILPYSFGVASEEKMGLLSISIGAR